MGRCIAHRTGCILRKDRMAGDPARPASLQRPVRTRIRTVVCLLCDRHADFLRPQPNDDGLYAGRRSSARELFRQMAADQQRVRQSLTAALVEINVRPIGGETMRTTINSMARSLAISRRGLVAGGLSISVARADGAARE